MKDKVFDLTGEVAVVTGGTGHLGYFMAQGLSEYGATVVITSRDLNRAKMFADKIISETDNNKVIGLELDISDRLSICNCFMEISKSYSGFNILINNASYSIRNNIERMTEFEWQNGLEGTVTSVFKCIQESIPYLKDSRHNNKSIVNISSMYGIVSPDPNIYGDSGYDNPPNYGSGKAAIIQLTKYAACHLARDNIRVNAISPGPFPRKKVQENVEFVRNLENKVPLRRIGQPHELKGAVIYLSSSASSYVTGHNLVVDGGWTVW